MSAAEKAGRLSTEALRHLGHLSSPEDKPRSAEHPLGGLVHVSGIGQIPVEALRAELDRRQV